MGQGSFNDPEQIPFIPIAKLTEVFHNQFLIFVIYSCPH